MIHFHSPISTICVRSYTISKRIELESLGCSGFEANFSISIFLHPSVRTRRGCILIFLPPPCRDEGGRGSISISLSPWPQHIVIPDLNEQRDKRTKSKRLTNKETRRQGKPRRVYTVHCFGGCDDYWRRLLCTGAPLMFRDPRSPPYLR